MQRFHHPKRYRSIYAVLVRMKFSYPSLKLHQNMASIRQLYSARFVSMYIECILTVGSSHVRVVISQNDDVT